MTGQDIGLYWKVTLGLFCPLLLAVFILGGFVDYGLNTPLTYLAYDRQQVREIASPYPMWAYALVTTISLVSVCGMPVAAGLYHFDKFDLAAFFARKEEARNAAAEDRLELKSSPDSKPLV